MAATITMKNVSAPFAKTTMSAAENKNVINLNDERLFRSFVNFEIAV